MIECKCGNDFDTPFCPQCGETASSPLHELLAYCRRHAKANKARADTEQHKLQENPNNCYLPSRIEGALKGYHKFQSWADAIGQVIKNANQT